MNLRTTNMAERIGNFLGTFETWDEKEFHRLGRYLGVRTWIDVTKPLKRGTVIPRVGKSAVKILFKYERLADLCFGCGALDHILRDCDLKEESWAEDDDSNLPYGPWVRASPLKPANVTVMKQEGRPALGIKIPLNDKGESSPPHPKGTRLFSEGDRGKEV